MGRHGVRAGRCLCRWASQGQARDSRVIRYPVDGGSKAMRWLATRLHVVFGAPQLNEVPGRDRVSCDAGRRLHGIRTASPARGGRPRPTGTPPALWRLWSATYSRPKYYIAGFRSAGSLPMLGVVCISNRRRQYLGQLKGPDQPARDRAPRPGGKRLDSLETVSKPCCGVIFSLR